jgi:hypothetical protein
MCRRKTFSRDSTKIVEIASILRSYLNLPPEETDVETIFDTYIAEEFENGDKNPDYNPFISDFIETSALASGGNKLETTELQQQTMHVIGGLNVTNLADGLAKFIVERAKTELNIAFFNRFKKELDNQKELQILFPQTRLVLRAIDAEIYNYSVYLETLKCLSKGFEKPFCKPL